MIPNECECVFPQQPVNQIVNQSTQLLHLLDFFQLCDHLYLFTTGISTQIEIYKNTLFKLLLYRLFPKNVSKSQLQ